MDRLAVLFGEVIATRIVTALGWFERRSWPKLFLIAGRIGNLQQLLFNQFREAGVAAVGQAFPAGNRPGRQREVLTRLHAHTIPNMRMNASADGPARGKNLVRVLPLQRLVHGWIQKVNAVAVGAQKVQQLIETTGSDLLDAAVHDRHVAACAPMNGPPPREIARPPSS